MDCRRDDALRKHCENIYKYYSFPNYPLRRGCALDNFGRSLTNMLKLKHLYMYLKTCSFKYCELSKYIKHLEIGSKTKRKYPIEGSAISCQPPTLFEGRSVLIVIKISTGRRQIHSKLLVIKVLRIFYSSHKIGMESSDRPLRNTYVTHGALYVFPRRFGYTRETPAR